MKYSIALALLALLPSSAWAQKAALPAGTFMASPCATTGFLSPRVFCAGDLSPITIGGGDLTGSLTAPTIAKMQGTTITGVVGSGKAVLDGAADRLRSLQSFGADGTDATDTTSAVSTALNSGVPLVCNGKFRVSSLITITNVNVFMIGGNEGCVLDYSTANSMIYATLTGASLYLTNHFTFANVKIAPGAAITAVTGAPHTAALDIEYPLGTNGITLPTVTLTNVSVKPTASSNYILVGVYLMDATNVWITNFLYESDRAAYQSLTRGIVYDGTHSPTNLHVVDSIAYFAGNGLHAPLETATGWQGIRVKGFDCVYCGSIVKLIGASDGLSDYADLTGVEGAFQDNGIFVQNVSHALIHDNYVFMADMPISGGIHAAFPDCVSSIWTLAIGSNGAANDISHNTCDGAQVTGYTGRYGAVLTGVSGTNMASHLGINDVTNLDFAFTTTSNTAGWLLEHQSMKGVTSEWQDSSTLGANTAVPPLWEPMTAAQLTTALTCNAASKGQQREITDAAATPVYNATMTGGGGGPPLLTVMCNGTNWTNH